MLKRNSQPSSNGRGARSFNMLGKREVFLWNISKRSCTRKSMAVWSSLSNDQPGPPSLKFQCQPSPHLQRKPLWPLICKGPATGESKLNPRLDSKRKFAWAKPDTTPPGPCDLSESNLRDNGRLSSLVTGWDSCLNECPMNLTMVCATNV